MGRFLKISSVSSIVFYGNFSVSSMDGAVDKLVVLKSHSEIFSNKKYCPILLTVVHLEPLNI